MIFEISIEFQGKRALTLLNHESTIENRLIENFLYFTEKLFRQTFLTTHAVDVPCWKIFNLILIVFYRRLKCHRYENLPFELIEMLNFFSAKRKVF